MALEEFSRGKRILIIVCSVVGAAVFTVTGAMMASAESCGRQSNFDPFEAGATNGETLTRSLFSARQSVINRFALGGVIASPSVPVFPDEGLKTELAWRNIPEGEQRYPLFALWPAYQDQRVRLFEVAVQKALEKGFRLPTRAAARAWFQAQLFRNDVVKEEERDGFSMTAWYENWGVSSPVDFERAIGELMVLNDYVSSLVSTASPDPTQQLEAYRRRQIEINTRAYRLKVDGFTEAAKAQVEKARVQEELADLVSGMTGSGRLHSYRSHLDAIRENPTWDEQQALKREAEVAVDVVAANLLPLAGASPFHAGIQPSESDKQEFYRNFLKYFRVIPEHAEASVVDARFARLNSLAVKTDAFGKAFDKERLKNYYDYYEETPVNVSVRIDSLMRQYNGEQQGPVLINAFKRDMDKLKEDRRKRLNADSSAKEAWREIPKGQADLLGQVSYKLTTLGDNVVTNLSTAYTKAAAAETGFIAARNIYNELRNRLFDLSSSTSLYMDAQGLYTTLGIASLEKQLDDQRSNLQRDEAKLEATTDEELKVSLGGSVARLRFTIEGMEAKLKLAQELQVKVDSFLSSLQSYLAGVERRAFTARFPDDQGVAQLRTLIEELVTEIPAEVKKLGEGLVDEDRKRALDEEYNLRRAEALTFTNDISRIVEDFSDSEVDDFYLRTRATRERASPLMAGKVALNFFNAVPADSPRTLEDIAKDPNWSWLASLAPARSFLTDANNRPGALSQVIERPGHGWFLLRLTARNAERNLAPEENPELAEKLVIKRVARELARAEMERIRLLANEQGSMPKAQAFLDQQSSLTSVDFGWFSWNGTPQNMLPMADPTRTYASALSEQRPYDALFVALNAVGPKSPVSTVFIEGEGTGIDASEYFSVALLTGRRQAANAATILPTSEYELQNVLPDIMATRLMQNPELALLLNPAELAKGTELTFHPDEYILRGEGKGQPEEQ